MASSLPADMSVWDIGLAKIFFNFVSMAKQD